MQLYLGGVCGRVVTKSHFGHRAKSGQKMWGCDSSVELEVVQDDFQPHPVPYSHPVGGW